MVEPRVTCVSRETSVACEMGVVREASVTRVKRCARETIADDGYEYKFCAKILSY